IIDGSHAIPPHVRHFQPGDIGETDDLTRDHPQPFIRAVLIAHIEQHLQTETDSEERFVRSEVVADRRNKIQPPQFMNGVAESSDSGQDQLLAALEVTRMCADASFRSDLFETFLDAPQVPHSIIDNADHFAIVSHDSTLSQSLPTERSTFSG